MSIIEQFIAILAPFDCIRCGLEGPAVCMPCLNTLSPATQRCYRCNQPTPGSVTCLGCTKITPLQSVKSITPYSGLARDILWKLKSDGAQSLSKQIASQLVPLLPAGQNWVLVPVPTASGRIRQRGYDQARLIAKQLSKQSAIKIKYLLIRTGQTHQVGATRPDRLKQIQGSFRVKNQNQIKGLNIILIDDVLTTGATLETASIVLKTAGANTVRAVTFAAA